MAQGRQHDYDREFAFINVQILHNEKLGSGSYGVVYKARCDQLVCAAKKIFPALLQQDPPEPGREHAHPLRRFESECQFLERINHPNIVQYLGVHREPGTDEQVLLMELMDESLTHFLESSPGDLPYHTQVNLSYDIAQALAFLHSNGIIHRDLSSNNVLLFAGTRAKVTDFGMSRLLGLNRNIMTKCPGTPAFMPPEAVNEQPIYSEKIDNFSFGVLIVQIITRQYPDPTDRFKEVNIVDPQYPSRPLRSLVPETERRKQHIDLIPLTHPLLPVATDCLNDDETKRPTSQELCQYLDTQRESPEYETSAQENILQTKIEQILAQNQEIQAKDEIIHEKDEQIQEKNEQLQEKDEQIRNKDEQIQIKENDLVFKLHQLQHKEDMVVNQKDELDTKEETIERLTTQLRTLNQELESNQKIIAQQTQTLARMKGNNETTFSQGQLEETSAQPKDERSSCNITIQDTIITPSNILPVSSALIGNKVYFTSRNKKTIHEYDTINKTWSEITDHPLNGGFSIVNVENLLTTVGGDATLFYSNKLYCYQYKKWYEFFSPMNNVRHSPAVIFVEGNLIVIGGDMCKIRNSIHYSAGSIEIMNTETLQWQTLSPLPQSSYIFGANYKTNYFNISATIHNDSVYIIAQRYIESFGRQTMQYTCPLSRILQKENVYWNETEIPNVYSNCIVSTNGHLLTINSLQVNQCFFFIHKYNPQNDNWEQVGEMSVIRSMCTATLLPDNVFMITGSESENKCSADFICIN